MGQHGMVRFIIPNVLQILGKAYGMGIQIVFKNIETEVVFNKTEINND